MSVWDHGQGLHAATISVHPPSYNCPPGPSDVDAEPNTLGTQFDDWDTLPCPPWKGHYSFLLLAELDHEIWGSRGLGSPVCIWLLQKWLPAHCPVSDLHSPSLLQCPSLVQSSLLLNLPPSTPRQEPQLHHVTWYDPLSGQDPNLSLSAHAPEQASLCSQVYAVTLSYTQHLALASLGQQCPAPQKI